MTSTARTGPSPATVALTVVLPFGLGYFISYLFRTVNAVISPQLTAEIGMTAGDLGLLTSLYFIVFASFQLPLGILLDRYGPRWVQAGLLAVAAMGSAVFALGDSFVLLAIGRGLIGLGVSGCLMSALQANVLWWPRERLPLVNAVTATFGSVGALVSTVPVEVLAQSLGWRGVFGVLAALCLLVAVLVLTVTPSRDSPQHAAKSYAFKAELAGLKEVYFDAFFWRVSVLIFVHAAVYFSYQSLWMGAWLRDVAGLERLGVANALLLFSTGMFAGALSIGVIVDRIQKFGVRPLTIMAGGVALSIGTQCLFAAGVTDAPWAMCFAFGFFGSSVILVYAVLGQHFPQRLIGRINTGQNMLIFVTAFAAQWGIGAIIDLWPPLAQGRYDPEAQTTAMFVMIGLEAAAFVWFLWPRRKAN